MEEFNQRELLDAVSVIEEVIAVAARYSVGFLDSMESMLDEILAE